MDKCKGCIGASMGDCPTCPYYGKTSNKKPKCNPVCAATHTVEDCKNCKCRDVRR